MRPPTTCLLWTNPEKALSRPLAQQFARIETLFKDPHHWRHILQCRCCGTRYLVEYYEEIDWHGGDDPTWTTYVPIQSEDQLTRMRNAPEPMQLLDFFPRLQADRPKGADRLRVSWTGKGAS